MKDRELWLAHTFVELADTLVDEFDLIDLLSRLAARCQELFAPSEIGFLLADHGGALHVLASSSERLRLLELFELQNEEGPCYDCFRTSEPVLNLLIEANGQRWPRFTAAARASGYQMAHAIPMRLRGQAIGAVNILQDHGREIEVLEAALMQSMADVATIGILQERAIQRASVLAEQLEGALNTRIIIEQAKGVLSERLSVDMVEAFARMRRYARSQNQRLVEVAGEVLSGRLPATALSAEAAPGGGSGL